jgi:predicted DCC family thiol-disulfide oxidoreductase YuxK
MSGLRQRLIATYLTFDPRSLALFRILLGIVLLGDLYRRYLGVDYWYTDDGIVPGMLLGQTQRHVFSLFFYASTHAQAVLGMAVCAVIYGLFTIGYRTRVFHLLSLVCAVSLNNRILLLENGGQYVLNLLCAWSLFLPLGRRFSMDALRASLRARRERTAEDLMQREPLRPGHRPVVSLAVLALLLQFSAIYLFNVLHKTGPAWQDGSAVHHALYHERLVTVFGVWIRENVPYSVLEALSWGTLTLEAAAVVFLLSPIWSRQLRLVAIVLLPTLHVGFGVCLHLGIFSWVMSIFFVLLLAPEHWEWWEVRRRSLGRRKVAYFDAECGMCFQFARVVARLDPFGRVRFVSNREETLPEGVTHRIAERAIVVEDVQSGRVSVGSRGIADLIGVLPFGRAWRLPLILPGPAWITGRLYDVIARNRATVSRRLGLAACGIPPEPVERSSERPAVRNRLCFPGIGLREAAVLLLMVAAVGDLAGNSPAWPRALRYRQPEFLDAIILYPRIR